NFPRIRLQRQRKFGPAVSAVVPSCTAPIHRFMATARQQSCASAFARAREGCRVIRRYQGPTPFESTGGMFGYPCTLLERRCGRWFRVRALTADVRALPFAESTAPSIARCLPRTANDVVHLQSADLIEEGPLRIDAGSALLRDHHGHRPD